SLIVEGTGSIFLAGPYLVKASIGEDVDAETLGGAVTQTDISGVVDNRYPDDKSCLDAIKRLFDKLGHRQTAGFDRTAPALPAKEPAELYSLLPADRVKPYDMQEIVERLVDKSEFDAYKPGYGQSLLCGYARIDGWAVGIVANQRKVVKVKGRTGQPTEMQMGGV
ncbi:carboxyl transferase domain-containing protein, partial [Escherichia coli]|uniref:carboxyl transferase domain-containing protein n=1 Tax=Escherichia coli TaxID=562 RepID=UPI002573F31C